MTLTGHKEGSLKELCSISLPLMLSSFSGMLMIFVDRLFLASYSVETLNASTVASTLGWGFVLAFASITCMAEVFVAQFHGANKIRKIGPAVWQMIWFSLFSIIPFFFLAFYFADWFYIQINDQRLEYDYFWIMMCFGPMNALYAALSAFWIGRGKPHLITGLIVASNGINIILDKLLIFGVDGWIPSMGIVGASLATGIGVSFQAIVLLVLFIQKKNRIRYGCLNYRYDKQLFWKSLKIGFPTSILSFMEISGWAVFYMMMTQVGTKYIQIAATCQSLAILFWFLPDGISKGVTAITGNLIGAKKYQLIPKVLWAGAYLHVVFFIFFLLSLIFTMDFWIMQFAKDLSKDPLVNYSLKICLLMIPFYVLLEGIRMLFSGVLVAAGDTLFLLYSGALSIWILAVFPAYYFVILHHATIETAISLWLFYGLIASLIYYWRYQTESWKSICLIEKD
jgi:MATE family multidrug resistance protein